MDIPIGDYESRRRLRRGYYSAETKTRRYLAAANALAALDHAAAVAAQAADWLADATAGDDFDALERAISRAKASGVAATKIDEGEQRLDALREAHASRVAALDALSVTLIGEDVAAIDAAVAECLKAGVPKPALKDAATAKAELEARLAARADAVAQLDAVAEEGGDDVDAYELSASEILHLGEDEARLR